MRVFLGEFVDDGVVADAELHAVGIAANELQVRACIGADVRRRDGQGLDLPAREHCSEKTPFVDFFTCSFEPAVARRSGRCGKRQSKARVR